MRSATTALLTLAACGPIPTDDDPRAYPGGWQKVEGQTVEGTFEHGVEAGQWRYEFTEPVDVTADPLCDGWQVDRLKGTDHYELEAIDPTCVTARGEGEFYVSVWRGDER